MYVCTSMCLCVPLYVCVYDVCVYNAFVCVLLYVYIMCMCVFTYMDDSKVLKHVFDLKFNVTSLF